jgi:hypothetical protein
MISWGITIALLARCRERMSTGVRRFFVERIYRAVFSALFILGFVGAIASANKDVMKPLSGQAELKAQQQQEEVTAPKSNSLIQDLRLAEEVNAINEGRWNQDVADINEDGLSRVEAILGR